MGKEQTVQELLQNNYFQQASWEFFPSSSILFGEPSPLSKITVISSLLQHYWEENGLPVAFDFSVAPRI